jgi:hypothetical protein
VTPRRAAGEPGPDHDKHVRDLAAQAANRQQQLREIVDQWFPLADWQREKLSLLLNPGRGRHDAA